MRHNLVNQAADIAAAGVCVVHQNAERQGRMIRRIEIAAEGVGVAERSGFTLEATFRVGAFHSITQGAAAARDSEGVAVDSGVFGFGHGLKRIDEGFRGGEVLSREAGAIYDIDAVLGDTEIGEDFADRVCTGLVSVLAGGADVATQGFEHGLSVNVDTVEVGGINKSTQGWGLNGGQFD